MFYDISNGWYKYRIYGPVLEAIGTQSECSMRLVFHSQRKVRLISSEKCTQPKMLFFSQDLFITSSSGQNLSVLLKSRGVWPQGLNSRSCRSNLGVKKSG